MGRTQPGKSGTPKIPSDARVLKVTDVTWNPLCFGTHGASSDGGGLDDIELIR